jgi:hypothetical protein
VRCQCGEQYNIPTFHWDVHDFKWATSRDLERLVREKVTVLKPGWLHVATASKLKAASGRSDVDKRHPRRHHVDPVGLCVRDVGCTREDDVVRACVRVCVCVCVCVCVSVCVCWL